MNSKSQFASDTVPCPQRAADGLQQAFGYFTSLPGAPRTARPNTLKRMTVVSALLALLSTSAMAAATSTNSAATNRVLIIDPSSIPVAAGKATLSIGELQRAAGVYTGDYRVTVSPYFFKSEKGKLNIVVSDESMAR